MVDTILLPSLPASWPAGTQVQEHNHVLAPVTVTLEPTGQWYEAFAARKRRNRTLSQDEADQASLKPLELDSDISSQDEECEDSSMERQDPGKWKELDHYKVLGLGKYRFNATDEQIKKAYRKYVLLHHPDKKDKLPNGEDDDDYFKCIKISYDYLSNPVTRRSYDSVDPTNDDSIPSAPKTPMSVEKFLKNFGPVFERNAKWSDIQPVPKLGTKDSTREELDEFYGFWYNLTSWREFSYLDEEESNKNDDRDQKRYMERKNKKQRVQRKAEEMARLVNLVEIAMKADPRLKAMKEQEKAEKEAKKAARFAAANADKIAAKKAAEEAKVAAAKAEEEAKIAAKDQKAAREIEKKLIKGQRRAIRQSAKDANYFVEGELSQSDLERMMWVEALCEKMSLLEMNELTANFNKETFMAS
eukprot:Ihof_evm2s393 gene=Ihof_evmTU2s393